MLKIPTIAIVGQPNSGKSSLFQVLADKKSDTGTPTFDIEATEIDVYGDHFRIVDLPGIYSLNAVEPAEKITLDFISKNDVDIIINVVDATFITRGLELTTELMEFGKPMILMLNKCDLSDKHGIRIDRNALAKLIDIPIVNTTIVHGKGIKELLEAIRTQGRTPLTPKPKEYTYHIEEYIARISALINPAEFELNGSARFYAIKALENPKFLNAKILNDIASVKQEADQDLYEHHKRAGYETIALERHHIAMDISEKSSFIERKTKRLLEDRIDDYLMHPILGYAFIGLFLLVYFASIFYVGNFLSELMAAPLAYPEDAILSLKNTNEFLWHTVNGAYLGVSGIMGIVLPFFLPLVLLTAFFEETGYLSRIAFMVDGIFHKIGLHGKSVAPFVLGFGCAIPALYATRMIENPRDRKVTGILISFIPCSARIAVIFALTAAFTGPLWAILIFVWVLFVIAASGKVLSKIYTKPMGLILEIQPLKMPTFRHAFRKTWFKIKDFLREAFTFLIIGSILLSWIEYFNLAHYINDVLKPFIYGVLDLPEQISSTLVFGFFRKELIIVMLNQALGVSTFAEIQLTVQQIVVFLIFVTLYFPCFTTFVVIIKEFGKKIALYSAIFSVLIAAVSATLFKWAFDLFM